MRLVYLSALFLSLSVPSTFAEGKTLEARRLELREWVMSHAAPVLPTIAPEANDQAANLVDRLEFTNLARMESAGMLVASLPASPWSDSYWPTFAGLIANRYADPNYNGAYVWKTNFDYLMKEVGKGKIEIFSPAEKYDLLVGDATYQLSRRMISAGAPYANEAGEVESWFGICHGWAPASFMLPRPANSVKAIAANGQEIEFTPSDIKALGTLLWANGGGETRFVGGRCNDKKPNRDDGMRETNPDCFDTNPATWHLAVVNQIGVSKRSFVMDASAGQEVWNQPVFGYQYAYINPNTKKSSKVLAEAKVRLRDVENDPFKAHRAANAEYLVKIVMSLDYLAETQPNAEPKDTPENDSHTVVTYSYDLELDAEDNIVGGEWHSALHPDFLWVPAPDAEASSVGDSWLARRGDTAKWTGRASLPASWKAAAKMSSAQEQPLARVVKKLFEMSGDQQ